ncbi:putative MFS multidrug transporter [Aspergillus campestris IBT 28561]|uniref:MFS multidrug transporter n=1 Tax=Aspergillus campestris (strain IBT 28561) TaxID=1392248 RepID=A0A2I1CYX5_ASPC2|nr:putative MFS multidrug transporter [Aspergillus campestris IBT 28561]PKY02810.1 putative MFS multidrug transporter [Aspergillus campestris IBT 28561]
MDSYNRRDASCPDVIDLEADQKVKQSTEIRSKSIGDASADDSSADELKSPYTVLSEREKRFFIAVVSTVNFLGPVTATIYYPALGPLARELNVSESHINLTITFYLIILGIVPLLTAGFSDQNGRRLILIGCLVAFAFVNIALALQTSFPALVSLRCLQSFSTSNIAVVAAATVADVITRAERGKYLAYITLGPNIGSAVGPIVGGVLTQFLGWRSIFWLLAIFAALLAILVICFLRETCRALVGNGSIPPAPYNRTLFDIIRPWTPHTPEKIEETTLTTFKRRPSVLDALKILFDLESCFIILYNTALYCGFTAVTSSIPALYERTYGFNSLEVGLAYLPYVLGSTLSRWTVGNLADWNFARHARTAGITIQKNHQCAEQLARIPLERARLQLALPLAYLSTVFLAAYGWVIQREVHIAAPLSLLFLMGNTMTGTSNTLNLLNIDINAQRPATATAAMNFLRFTCGAGVAAAALPLEGAIGTGWMATLVSGVHWQLQSNHNQGRYFKTQDELHYNIIKQLQSHNAAM